MKSIIKTGEALETTEIPSEYIVRKPQERREEEQVMKDHPTHLRQMDTGRIYVYTDLLAKRADMEAYEFPVVIPEEELDELMGEVEEAPVEDEAGELEPEKPVDSERMAAIKEAISKILPEEYTRAIGKLKPAMPKVKQVSELAGFPVSGAEIAAAME